MRCYQDYGGKPVETGYFLMPVLAETEGVAGAGAVVMR